MRKITFRCQYLEVYALEPNLRGSVCFQRKKKKKKKVYKVLQNAYTTNRQKNY